MITNDEAVDNFLSGKRHLAAYQFSELLRLFIELRKANMRPNNVQDGNTDEIAFNYALVNLFTGCPQRAGLIFADLAKRYPKNPRLWLRLAESVLASERAKLDKFEHVQQNASNGDMCQMLLKTKNTPIFIKINPNYHAQVIQQHQQHKLTSGTSQNFLATVLGYLKIAASLISEYDDISLLTDDILPLTQATSNNGSSTTLQDQQIKLQLSTNDADPDAIPQSIIENQDADISARLSFSNPYQYITRSDLYGLNIKVQLELAYVCLCMGDPTQALEHTTRCLNLSPSGYEKVLANLYHAEACILLGRVDEAIQFLNIEIFNAANVLSEKHPVITGDTGANNPTINIRKQTKIVYGEDLKQQLESGALSTVLKYNLSVAYAAKGDIEKADELLAKTVNTSKPNPMQILICLLYIQLQQGRLESAKKTILNNLPQFR